VYKRQTTTPEYSAQTYGASAYFDGSGDYLTVPTNPAHATLGTSDFTVEGWFYFNTVSGTQLIFSHRNGSSGTAAYVPFLLWLANGTITLYASSDNASWNVVNGSTAGTVTANQWYHIAYTRTGTVFRIFVNGVQKYTYGSVGTLTCNQPFQVGMTGPGETNAALNGYVSDVRIIKGQSLYTTNFVPPIAPLTAVKNTTLLLNMDKAAIHDKSAKLILETVGDAKVSSTAKKYGTQSMYFDGSVDCLYCLNNEQLKVGTGDYTVEFWMYQTSAAGTKVILEIGRAGASSGVGFQIDTISGPLTVYYGSTIATAFASGVTPTLNTWNHIAMTRQSGSTKFFVNGVQAGSAFSDTTNYTQASLWLGANAGGGSGYFPGYIDDLRITKGYARYTANFTPPTAALITK
jgi:hypothetical protein